jgi:choline dehydrogenase-like flavoprotein
MAEERADVVVIGSGAAGAAATKRLAEPKLSAWNKGIG